MWRVLAGRFLDVIMWINMCAWIVGCADAFCSLLEICHALPTLDQGTYKAMGKTGKKKGISQYRK